MLAKVGDLPVDGVREQPDRFQFYLRALLPLQSFTAGYGETCVLNRIVVLANSEPPFSSRDLHKLVHDSWKYPGSTRTLVSWPDRETTVSVGSLCRIKPPSPC